MEVCTNLTNDKARPYISKAYSCKTLLKLYEECVEYSVISKTTVNLLGTNLVRDLWIVVCSAELLAVLDKLNSTTNNKVNIDNLALRNVNINGWVYVNEVKACSDSSLERCLNSVHSTLSLPTLSVLLVLEPWTTVVNSDDAVASEVDSLTLHAANLYKVCWCHACVTAISINLVKSSCKIDRCIVTLS